MPFEWKRAFIFLALAHPFVLYVFDLIPKQLHSWESSGLPGSCGLVALRELHGETGLCMGTKDRPKECALICHLGVREMDPSVPARPRGDGGSALSSRLRVRLDNLIPVDV